MVQDIESVGQRDWFMCDISFEFTDLKLSRYVNISDLFIRLVWKELV